MSVETRKWEWALNELGFLTRRIAGEIGDGLRPDDVWLPFLAIDPAPGATPEPDALAASLASADLVVVENLCSLPLNVEASTIAADVLDDFAGRVLFHHHDLPWEREHLAHFTQFPPRRPGSLHVVINELAHLGLEDRGITSHLIRNAFDLDPLPGDREATREAFGFSDEDIVVLQPTRAIPRKQVGSGIQFAEMLTTSMAPRPVRFWLTGPAEDGFGPELKQLVERATLPIVEGRATRAEDSYAAADCVVFPSSWEGFGNPVIEALVAELPVVVGHYPVLDELVGLGLELLSIEDPAAVAARIDAPDPSINGRNRKALEAHFDLRDLPRRIVEAFAAVGWDQW